jgi:hypothetical protein
MNNKPFLAALLLMLGAPAMMTPTLASSGTDGPFGKAATAYEQGDYRSAYKQYVKLAKKGDTFSQYRVSYMSLMGLGTGVDPVEAMAWAVVAAELDHETLGRYESAVAAMVPGELRKKAQQRADYYLRRWGREDRDGGRTLASTSEGSCTGSRLAANCGQAETGGAKWIAWGADKSRDPEHRRQIEELNELILQSAAQLASNNSG